MGWATADTKTDPAKDTILADTGALVAGLVTFTVIVESNSPTVTYLEQTDATGITVLKSQPLRTEGSRTFVLQIPITVALNDRYRLRLDNNAFTGIVKGSIIT